MHIEWEHGSVQADAVLDRLRGPSDGADSVQLKSIASQRCLDTAHCTFSLDCGFQAWGRSESWEETTYFIEIIDVLVSVLMLRRDTITTATLRVCVFQIFFISFLFIYSLCHNTVSHTVNHFVFVPLLTVFLAKGHWSGSWAPVSVMLSMLGPHWDMEILCLWVCRTGTFRSSSRA